MHLAIKKNTHFVEKSPTKKNSKLILSKNITWGVFIGFHGNLCDFIKLSEVLNSVIVLKRNRKQSCRKCSDYLKNCVDYAHLDQTG